MKSEIQKKLEQLAYNRTIPFCYGCYTDAPTGVCPTWIPPKASGI